jgi:hypothetical protein
VGLSASRGTHCYTRRKEISKDALPPGLFAAEIAPPNPSTIRRAMVRPRRRCAFDVNIVLTGDFMSYHAGVFDGNRRSYISRGVGHLLRVRFNVRPEVTIFELHGF